MNVDSSYARLDQSVNIICSTNTLTGSTGHHSVEYTELSGSSWLSSITLLYHRLTPCTLLMCIPDSSMVSQWVGVSSDRRNTTEGQLLEEIRWSGRYLLSKDQTFQAHLHNIEIRAHELDVSIPALYQLHHGNEPPHPMDPSISTFTELPTSTPFGVGRSGQWRLKQTTPYRAS